MVLEPLYKGTKTGAIQVCLISTEDDTFTVEFGQLDGKMQSKTTTCEPKNVGKANETSGADQALSEAQSKHAKKIKSGYVLDESGESEVRLPMKVKVIQDQWKNVIYPCISTPKLNGVNGTYRLEDEELNLYSRGGDIRPKIPHLENKILRILELLDTDEINVELYKHGQHLQDLSSAVTKTNELSSSLQAGIFDFILDGAIYEKRRNIMMHVDDMLDYADIYFLNGVVCETQEDIENDYNGCMDAGLEGTVVKNLNGLYVHGERSSDQFKYKKALDAEYRVVGHSLDKNGHAVWDCICNVSLNDYNNNLREMTPQETRAYNKLHTFSVKRKGTAPERLAEAAIGSTKHGQWLKLEYETLSKDKKPLKPVGIAWRECDFDGNPIE